MAYIMFKGKIEEQKANLLVRESLIKREYSRDLEMKRYLLDDGKIDYFITEKVTYHGQVYPKITRLTCSEYIELLVEELSLQYGTKYHVSPVISKDEVSYQVSEAHIPNRVKYLRKQRGK